MHIIVLAPKLIITVKENESKDWGERRETRNAIFVHLENVKTRLKLLRRIYLQIVSN